MNEHVSAVPPNIIPYGLPMLETKLANCIVEALSNEDFVKTKNTSDSRCVGAHRVVASWNGYKCNRSGVRWNSMGRFWCNAVTTEWWGGAGIFLMATCCAALLVISSSSHSLRNIVLEYSCHIAGISSW